MKAIICMLSMAFALVDTSTLCAHTGKSVTFKISNIPAKQGKILLSTADGKYYGMADGTGSVVEIKLDSLPNGKYKIYVFHDANDNKTLDKGPDNVPIEHCAIQDIEVTDCSKSFQVELIAVKDKKDNNE